MSDSLGGHEGVFDLLVTGQVRLLRREEASSQSHLLHLHEAEDSVKSSTLHSLANTFLKKVASGMEASLRVLMIQFENLVKRRFSHFANLKLELPLGERFFKLLVGLLL